MQKLRYFFISMLAMSMVVANGQSTISGKIVDSASKEPLRGASVFCQNTTIGTTTNKDGEFTLQLKSGGYELIISYTGYQTRQMRINHTDNRLPDIEMSKEEKSLGEVFIKSNNEVKDGWEKYGSFFTEHFIGTTPNAAACVLQNPEVLKFYFLKRSNKLRVMASEPLLVENKSLGYNLRYQLDSFVYYYNTDINLYRGFCNNIQMEGSDSSRDIWAANRKMAYYGSKLQFMRSYYDSTLKEDGFSIDMLDESNDKKFNPIANVYDTTYYGALDSTMQIEIWYPRKISVTYAKKKPEPEYIKKFELPKNVGTQISYVEITNTIAVKENGYYYDQSELINQGYWSWKNLADQLPYDYNPD